MAESGAAPRNARRAATCAWARARLGAVADQDEDEGELDHRRVQHGRLGHQHGPVERVLALAGQGARSRSSRAPCPRRPSAMPTEPIRMYFHEASTEALLTCSGIEHRGRDRRRLDGDPHDAHVVRVTATSMVKREQVGEDPEAPRLAPACSALVPPEAGAERGRQRRHEAHADARGAPRARRRAGARRAPRSAPRPVQDERHGEPSAAASETRDERGVEPPDSAR